MDLKAEVIKRYFRLSDLASRDDQACREIINLFADNAVVKGANGMVAATPAEITTFFENFFQDNQALRHLCQVVITNGTYQAEWAVAGRKQNGKLFAFHGFDTYEFDQNNKITFLQVEIRQ